MTERDAAPPPPRSARDDDERDAYLRAALRHAPDTDARPPEALSARILREARAAAAPTTPAGGRVRPAMRERMSSALRSLWDASARPSLAGAFATVVVATLVGVLWWDRPLEEPLSRPAAVAPASSTDTASARARADVEPFSTAPVEPAAPALPALPAPLAKRRDATRAEGAARSDANGPPTTRRIEPQAPEAFPGSATRERQVAPSRAQAPRVGLAPKTEAAKDASGATAPEPPVARPAEIDRTAPEPQRPAPAGALAGSARPPALAEPRLQDRTESAQAEARDASPAKSAGRARADSALSRAAPEPKTAQAPIAASPPPAPLDLPGLRARLSTEPERWTWSRGDGSGARPAATLRDWLARVDDALATPPRNGSRDERGAAGASPGAAPSARADGPGGNALQTAAPASTELRLFRTGRFEATVRVLPDAVEVIDAAGRIQHHPVDATTAAALAASLPR